MSSELFVYNFTTGEFEVWNNGNERDYVPDIPGSREAFDLYVKSGADPKKAALVVMSYVTGRHSDKSREIEGELKELVRQKEKELKKRVEQVEGEMESNV